MKDSEVTEKCQKTTKIKSEGISSFIALQGDQSNVVNEATKVDHYSLQEKIEIDDKWDSNCYMKETSKMKEFKQDLSCVSVSTISSPPLNHRQVLSPLMEKDSLNVVPSTSILPNKNSTNCVIQDQKSYLHRTYKENDPTKEMISFGSKNVSLATVQKVRHSKVSVLASELCNLVFSNRELALCSLKGKKTNAHKNSFQKQAIDEAKIKGIIEYIAKYFCKSPDNIKDEVYKAIGNKLNNFSKTFEGKKIINDYLAEKFAQQQQQVEANQQQQQQVEANQQQQQQVEANQQQQQQVEANQQQQKQDEANQQQQTDNVSFLRQIATLQQLATPQQQEALQQLINLANNNN
ncbi:hypothetical protein ALC62_04088 [Cyphomyrmex costatus]|uniref:BEN domain-containing protein n=1 Tax=Cyphomyrmex costatus TaxID=456900 RepID=A0A151IKL8_9HYME|nr:hypothetical protein ALC62_04088 [Cyphomyrmex costatus]